MSVDASTSLDHVLIAPDAESWSLSDETQRIYRKELIYADDFEKRDPKTRKVVWKERIDKAMLSHWKRTFDEMQADGRQVPLTLEHTINPERTRGTMVAAELGTNSRGLPALYGHFKFRDAEAEKLTKTANVSVFVPPEADNGKGKVYHRPLSGVALTDYPVVPALEGWTAIAASYGAPKMEIEMSMRAIAEMFGLEGDDARDDTAILSAVRGRFNSLTEENKKLKLQRRDLKRGTKGDDDDSDKKPKRIAASATPVMVNLLRENRQHKIAELSRTGKITPHVAKTMAERYLKDEPLALSLSATEEDPFDDGFDNLVATLSLNEPVISLSGGKTGPQGGTRLSKEGLTDPKQNPLIRDAERRAERAKARA